jgi:hypothetical protein
MSEPGHPIAASPHWLFSEARFNRLPRTRKFEVAHPSHVAPEGTRTAGLDAPCPIGTLDLSYPAPAWVGWSADRLATNPHLHPASPAQIDDERSGDTVAQSLPVELTTRGGWPRSTRRFLGPEAARQARLVGTQAPPFSTVTCFVPRRLFLTVRSGASGSYVPSLFRDDTTSGSTSSRPAS